ncbi:CST complex subunit TEN1 isoform X1 [Dunckerocampus dactyliophorus]|uniref:CST complex subunit TEN1 isoform X1 n=1 Tax=Dunckerocampus dactyliophorus TaxID=161453 RepID=UPI00240754EF|nr:CST complex subunit TEN1 isoform X1 [Dunckerocampus dactyliophorus]
MMLPAHATYYFQWEIKPGALPEGVSVRTFGRLTCYEQDMSRATLTAQHASKEHHVVINTSLVEPFHPIIGAQYLVLGETDSTDGVDMMVRARVLNCIDGVNIPRLQKAITEQRRFFKERESHRDDAVHNAT